MFIVTELSTIAVNDCYAKKSAPRNRTRCEQAAGLFLCEWIMFTHIERLRLLSLLWYFVL